MLTWSCLFVYVTLGKYLYNFCGIFVYLLRQNEWYSLHPMYETHSPHNIFSHS